MQKVLFYNKFISCLYMFRTHVLSIRRSKLHYTASDIMKLKQMSGLKLLKYNFINFTTICSYLQNCILLNLDHSLVSV